MNKIFKISANILFWLVLIILLLYLILKLTNIVGIYKVITGSMEPKIKSGDYILVIKSKEYKKGDIVTYFNDGYYVTHRIESINGNKVVTKGDANNKEDEVFDSNSIIGKLIYKGKLLNVVIRFKYYIIFLFLLLYLASLFVKKYIKEKE